VTAILEDRAGRLWAGSYGGLAVFENGRFHKATGPTLPQGMIVQAICEDRDGALWFGTTVGLSRYKDGVTQALSPPKTASRPTTFT
jgi:ligand-binding sensor domain-containing protein